MQACWLLGTGSTSRNMVCQSYQSRWDEVCSDPLGFYIHLPKSCLRISQLLIQNLERLNESNPTRGPGPWIVVTWCGSITTLPPPYAEHKGETNQGQPRRISNLDRGCTVMGATNHLQRSGFSFGAFEWFYARASLLLVLRAGKCP